MDQLESNNKACTKKRCEISYSDLPLACPLLGDRVWDAHPRVYLPIEEVGELVCPYCGTEYVLRDFDPERSSLKLVAEKKISAKVITPENKTPEK